MHPSQDAVGRALRIICTMARMTPKALGCTICWCMRHRTVCFCEARHHMHYMRCCRRRLQTQCPGSGAERQPPNGYPP